MPFTISHSITALLFYRTPLPFVSVVVGTLAPDIPYYFTVYPFDEGWHDFESIFTRCIPAGFMLLIIFEYLLKEQLIRLFPESHYKKLVNYSKPLKCLDVKIFLLSTLGIIVGAITHIVWDSFTHFEGWVVQKFPVLISIAIDFGSYQLRIFNLLQYCSSLLGLIVIFCAYKIWLRSLPIANVESDLTIQSKIYRILANILVAIVFSSYFIYVHYFRSMEPPVFQVILRQSAVYNISFFFLSILIYSIICKFAKSIR